MNFSRFLRDVFFTYLLFIMGSIGICAQSDHSYGEKMSETSISDFKFTNPQWETNGVCKRDYALLADLNRITSPEIDLTGCTEVTVYVSGGTYGRITSKNEADFQVLFKNQNGEIFDLGTKEPRRTEKAPLYFKKEATEWGKGFFVIECPNATKAGGRFYGATVYAKKDSVTPPTPEAPVLKPTISIPSQEFSESFSVEITTTEKEAVIRYTVDGQNPSVNVGTLYEGPITIPARTTTLKAVAIRDHRVSDVVSATYTYVPNQPEPPQPGSTLIYKKVTDPAELKAGDCFIIVNEKDRAALSYQKPNNRDIVYIRSDRFVNDEIHLSAESIARKASDRNVYELILGGTEGAWTFEDSCNRGFLCAPSSTSNQLEITQSVNNTSQASISFDPTGNAVIKFNDAKNRNCLSYLRGGEVFSCYSSVQNEIQLYRRTDKTVTRPSFSINTPEGYGTFYSEKAFVMPQNVQGAVILSSGTDHQLAVQYLYPAGSTVPARTALLLKGEVGKYEYTEVPDANEAAPKGNLLHGTVDENGMAFVEGASKYYMLSYNQSHTNLGFYWKYEQGAPFKNGKNKAYLALSETESALSPISGFAIEEMSDVTGLHTPVGLNQHPLRIYDLNGRRIQAERLNDLSEGIYIVNGTPTLIP